MGNPAMGIPCAVAIAELNVATPFWSGAVSWYLVGRAGWVRSGAPVPLDDGLRIRQDVEILGDPKVQARGGGGQHVVVKLHFAMVPFAHFPRREPAAPLGRSGQLAHEPMRQRIDVSWNLNRAPKS